MSNNSDRSIKWDVLVFSILTIIFSVIGFAYVLYFFIAGGHDFKMIGMLFGLSLAVIPYIISKSISDLNHTSNLNFSHKD